MIPKMGMVMQKKVQNRPSLCNRMYRNAHAWINGNINIGEIVDSEADVKKYIVSSAKCLSTKGPNTLEKLKSIQNKKWNSFDDFK